MHCDRCLTVRFNLYFPVKEFEEEVDGEIHHRHHLLSTVALIASPGYDMAAEDPRIFSDPEVSPHKSMARSSNPKKWCPSCWNTCYHQWCSHQDLQLQHDTAVKVLKHLGVDACRDLQKSSAVGVLARVRQGNKTCTICIESFSSTQVLRTHIQGNTWMPYTSSAASVHTMQVAATPWNFTWRPMLKWSLNLCVIILVVGGPMQPKATWMNTKRSTLALNLSVLGVTSHLPLNLDWHHISFPARIQNLMSLHPRSISVMSVTELLQIKWTHPTQENSRTLTLHIILTSRHIKLNCFHISMHRDRSSPRHNLSVVCRDQSRPIL